MVSSKRVFHLDELIQDLDLACKRRDDDYVAALKSDARLALSHGAALEGQGDYISKIYDAKGQADNTMVWQEVQKELKTGDMIFSTGLSVLSKMIHVAHGSEISHIGMAVRPLESFVGPERSAQIRRHFLDA